LQEVTAHSISWHSLQLPAHTLRHFTQTVEQLLMPRIPQSSHVTHTHLQQLADLYEMGRETGRIWLDLYAHKYSDSAEPGPPSAIPGGPWATVKTEYYVYLCMHVEALSCVHTGCVVSVCSIARGDCVACTITRYRATCFLNKCSSG
jgi:hypothetical protein